MEYKILTKKIKIPVLGLGTWKIGGKLEPDYSQDGQNLLLIKEAIKLGYSHIDTAEKYGHGHAEELVGQAIQDFNRKELFITTKISPENLGFKDVLNSARASLKRLQTNYIDLYLIHAPNRSIEISQTMKALDRLVDDGLVRLIGVSNFSVADLKAAQKWTKNKIVANQIEYNLVARNQGQFTFNMEKEIIPFCQQHNIIIIAYRPLAKGFLSQSKILEDLSKKYHKTPAQIAINWLISKKNIITIPKSTNISHLRENLEALGWPMDLEDLVYLNDKFPNIDKELAD